MQEEIVNIKNSVHIDVDGNKVKIKCIPARDSLPIPVVESIVKSAMAQYDAAKKEERSDELMNAFIEEYGLQTFKRMLAWKIVSFILAAVIVGLLIFGR